MTLFTLIILHGTQVEVVIIWFQGAQESRDSMSRISNNSPQLDLGFWKDVAKSGTFAEIRLNLSSSLSSRLCTDNSLKTEMSCYKRRHWLNQLSLSTLIVEGQNPIIWQIVIYALIQKRSKESQWEQGCWQNIG